MATVAGLPAARGSPATTKRHVGTAVCAECHKEAWEQWRGSHHDLAMQVADESTVLGDFDKAKFDTSE